jgi:glutamate-1-semialdehyde 2,1-aminomutase
VSRTFALNSSAALFGRARQLIPGGVGSNDRALVHPHPIFVERGEGSRIWDVDGNQYIDYLLAYGPLVLGHANPQLAAAVAAQMKRGSVFGAPHKLEIEAAEQLIDLIPSFEMVRFQQSGTEAVLAAMRLARAATGRPAILKFEGHYHGWSDQVAISYAPNAAEAGPGDSPQTVPMSQGQPPGSYQDSIVIGWNDLDAAKSVFAAHGERIAGVLTEAVACNIGVIEPNPGYLEGLRHLCDEYGALLIFDEVQTGFRVHLRGAQGLLGVTPDLTCMGKALSGGLPISAVGGRRDVMELIADRKVFHAGTYNANPLGLAAVSAVIQILSGPGVFEQMARLSQLLRSGLADILQGIGGYVQGSTTVFGTGFGPGPVSNMREAWRNDTDSTMALKKELRIRGVYTKPTPRDIWYMSTAHTAADVQQTLEIAAEAADAIARADVSRAD